MDRAHPSKITVFKAWPNEGLANIGPSFFPWRYLLARLRKPRRFRALTANFFVRGAEVSCLADISPSITILSSSLISLLLKMIGGASKSGRFRPIVMAWDFVGSKVICHSAPHLDSASTADSKIAQLSLAEAHALQLGKQLGDANRTLQRMSVSRSSRQ